jgi:hypothetical protein
MNFNIDIDKKLLDEIINYANVNNKENISIFVVDLIRTGFNIEKYGNKPHNIQNKPIKKIVNKKTDLKNNSKDLYGE